MCMLFVSMSPFLYPCALFHCCRYCLKAILIVLPLMGFTWLFGTLAAFNYSEVVRDIFSGLFIVCNTFQVCAKLKWTLSCSTGFNLPTFVSTFASVTCTHHTSCGYGTFLLCILFAGSYSCCCFAYVCVCGGGHVGMKVGERESWCVLCCVHLHVSCGSCVSIHTPYHRVEPSLYCMLWDMRRTGENWRGCSLPKLA